MWGNGDSDAAQEQSGVSDTYKVNGSLPILPTVCVFWVFFLFVVSTQRPSNLIFSWWSSVSPSTFFLLYFYSKQPNFAVDLLTSCPLILSLFVSVSLFLLLTLSCEWKRSANWRSNVLHSLWSWFISYSDYKRSTPPHPPNPFAPHRTHMSTDIHVSTPSDTHVAPPAVLCLVGCTCCFLGLVSSSGFLLTACVHPVSTRWSRVFNHFIIYIKHYKTDRLNIRVASNTEESESCGQHGGWRWREQSMLCLHVPTWDVGTKYRRGAEEDAEC